MLHSELPEGIFKIVTVIEYFGSEDSFSIQGDGYTTDDKFIRYIKYSKGFGFTLQPYLLLWYRESASRSIKWNRAKFVTRQDYTDEVQFLWDEALV